MRKVFKTENTLGTGMGMGVCVAMTLDWMSESTKLGRVTKLSQLNKSTWVETQSKVETGGLGMLTSALGNFGLTRKDSGIASFIAPTSVPDQILKSTGFVLILAESEDGESGHAMGARNEIVESSAVLEYFEPNIGLYTPETEVEDEDDVLESPVIQFKKWFIAQSETLWSKYTKYKLYVVG